MIFTSSGEPSKHTCDLRPIDTPATTPYGLTKTFPSIGECQNMGTGVALSQVQELIRENAALRQERDRLIQLLAALGHAGAEGASASTWHPADVSLIRWPAIPISNTVSHRNAHPDDLPLRPSGRADEL